MGSDPDAPWRPGYEGPAPVAGGVGEFRPPDSGAGIGRTDTPGDPAPPVRAGVDEFDTGVAPGTSDGSRNRRRVLPAAGAIAALVFAGVVVLRGSDAPGLTGSVDSTVSSSSATGSNDDTSLVADEPASLDQTGGVAFSGADPRRLPSSAGRLWTVPVPGSNDDVVLTAIDSRYVVLVASDPASVTSNVMQVLDATDGTVRWEVTLPAPVTSQRVIGVVGRDDAEVLFVESLADGRRVTAYALESGAPRWSRDETAEEEQVGESGPTAGFEILTGTAVLARVPVRDTDPTLLLDPTTGTAVGSLDGRILGTDGLGLWFVSNSDGIVSYDLTDGYSEPEAVSPVLVDDGGVGDRTGREVDAVTIVDGVVVAAARDELLVEGARGSGLAGPVVETTGSGRVGVPTAISAVEAMAGSTFLVAGAGRVVGAALEGDRVLPTWERRGAVLDTASTDRGTVLLLANEGGARQELVDGRTGRTLLSLTLTPGVFESLVIAGNGIVARVSSPDGPRLSGLDLDGAEMWSLPGTSNATVGNGIVVRVEQGLQGSVVAAYGDAGASAAEPS